MLKGIVALNNNKRQKMKKIREKHIETREEKEARWAKCKRQARSFARQAGIKIDRKPKLSEKYDY